MATKDKVRYQPLGPLLSGEGSRAFLGLSIPEDGEHILPVVFVWVPEKAAEDVELLGKIVRETEAASRIEHPNVSKVYGLHEVEGGLARVVEYADGEMLRRVLDLAQRMPPGIAARLIADACMGVHFAHEAGNDDGSPLVHGDIRPETLLVSYAGVTKATGYGALEVAPKELHGRRVKGRRLYVSPEQVLGGRQAVTRETDVYLLGLTLYECLTGEVPYANAKDYEEAVVYMPIPSLGPAGVPFPLIQVVEKTLAKKASERYPTALALREAITEAMGGLPPQSEVGAFMERLFPVDGTERAARNKELAEGLAEARRKGDDRRKEQQPVVVERRSGGERRDPLPAVKVFLDDGPPLPEEKPIETEPHGMPLVRPTDDDMARVALEHTPLPRRSPLLEGAAAFAETPEATQPDVSARTDPDVAVNAAGAPKPASRPAVRGSREDEEAERPRRAPERKSSLPWVVIGMAIAVAGVAVGWGLSQQKTVVVTPPAPPPVTLAPPEPRPEPKPEPKPALPPIPDEKPLFEPPSIDVSTEPGGEVFVDGKSWGPAPVSKPVEAGKHVVRLVNKEKHIDASRTLNVQDAHTKVRIALGSGTVSINAPAAAAVSIDGKVVGKGPVTNYRVFEGTHRFTVSLGKAKYAQPFVVKSGETLNYDVSTTAE